VQIFPPDHSIHKGIQHRAQKSSNSLLVLLITWYG